MSAVPGVGGDPPVPVEVPSLALALVPPAAAGMNVGKPAGVAMAQNTCMVLLPAEFRASCQQTAMLPERMLLAMRGRNWLRTGSAGSSLTRVAALQVPPLSSE